MLRSWPAIVLCLSSACDTTAPPASSAIQAGTTAAAPLPADMVRACPGLKRPDRSASACTDIGCLNGFQLNVSPSSGWAAGMYQFELTVDGRAITCQGAIPLLPCSEPSFPCDADGVRLGVSGCALPATQQGIASIMFDGYPEAVSLRVLRNGSELQHADLTPTYTSSQPNGKGCEPVCCSAGAELSLQP